jgi:hypothetical protein
MQTCFVALMSVFLGALNRLPQRDIDLRTATLFHERLDTICRQYGLQIGYGGFLAHGGWPLGVQARPWRTQSLTWHATSGQRDGFTPIILRIAVSLDSSGREVASCKINGQSLYLCVVHVHEGRTVDDPIPPWALSSKAKTSGITVRKLLRSLAAEPAPQRRFERDRDDAAKIDLHTLNLFHYGFSEIANHRWLCVYYRGPLGRHPTFGRGGIRLPDTTNSILTWSITLLEDTYLDQQRFVCQITGSLTKQHGCIPVCLGDGSTLYLSASLIIGNKGPDEKISEL